MTFLAPNTTPGTYEFQVCDLLHDPNFNRWTESQIDGYINEARKKLVMDRGCLRTLQPSYLTGGQESYQFGQVMGATITNGGANYSNPSVTFAGGGGTGVAATLTQSGGAVNTITFTSFGSGYSSAPTATITDTGAGSGATLALGVCSSYTYDLLGINCFQGGGAGATQRYALQWYPWRRFSAWYRPYAASAYQRQPAAWAVYGDTSFFIGPPPDQSYMCELDSIILPTPFAIGDTTTVDPIPVLSQEPIKFYAAYLAKKNAQSLGEAAAFYDDYNRTMHEVVAAYTGRLPDPYQG